MGEHFNELTPAEHERLALLMEECGEVVQIIGKILRHGYESRHPNGGPTNRGLLMKELGDVHAAQRLLIKADDIAYAKIREHSLEKQETVAQYLHHQR